MDAEREALLAAVAAEPESLEPGLRIFIERAVGLEGEIDLVARDTRGGVVVIGVAAHHDLLALAHTLAQRSWLLPRVADWARLAPQLGLEPSLGVRVVLCAPRFDPRTEALASALGDALVALHPLPQRAHIRAEAPPAATPAAGAMRAPGAPEPQEEVPRGQPALRSRFRTGLRDGAPAAGRPRSAPRGVGAP